MSRIRNDDGIIHFTIENFGPVEKAEIDIKPLTVFIGINNSGKSYTSTIIHTILRTLASFSDPLVGPWLFLCKPYLNLNENALYELFMKKPTIKDMAIFIMDVLNKGRGYFQVPQSIIAKIISSLEKELNHRIENEITRAFAVVPGELRHNNRKEASIIVELNNIKMQFIISQSEVKSSILDKQEVRMMLVFRRRAMFIKIFFKKDLLVKQVPLGVMSVLQGLLSRPLDDIDVDEQEIAAVLFIVNAINAFGEIISGQYKRYLYLPAARAGVAQTYRILAAETMRSQPIRAIMESNARGQRYSGAIGELASTIIQLESTMKGMPDLADIFENELMQGSVRLKNQPNGMMSEIIYQQFDQKYPIHTTASGIAEMALLVLYIRHLVRKNTFLVIEEPEAHLHPENQVKIAQLISRLVNNDVSVLITTHSDYILESLSHCVRSFGLKGEIEEIPNESKLSSSKIAVYVFNQKSTKNDTYTIVEKVEISPEEGINQEEFLRVVDILGGVARSIDRIALTE